MIPWQLLPIAADDLAWGFDVVEHPSGAVVLDLGGGLYAVKVLAADGAVEYVTCDENLHPLYEPAKSLLELKQRFSRAKRRSRSGR